MRRFIAFLGTLSVLAALMVAAPVSANALPSDVTVTNSVTCGMAGDMSIVNNTSGSLNLISETVQYPSGNINFPDPSSYSPGGGPSHWEFFSNEGDIAYHWIVKNADTNEVYYDQWYAFNCDTVSADLTKSVCGTSGSFAGINGFATPQTVYYETQSNGAGSTVTRSADVVLSTAFQQVPWSYMPKVGDFSFDPGNATFDLTVKNSADNSIIASQNITLTCSKIYVSSLYCAQSSPEFNINVDATNDLVSHVYELRVNGVTAYGPTTVAPGTVLNDVVHPAGLIPGSTYTAYQYLDGTLTISGLTGAESGTVPGCMPPVFTSGPTLTGTVRVGYVVTCSATGTSANLPVYLERQWLLNGVVMPNITATSIRLTASQYGKYIACRVSLSDGQSETPVVKTSNAIKVAAGVAPRIVSPYYPRITGTPARGKYLAVYVGRWTPAPTSYRCVWFKYSGTKVVRVTSLIKCSVKFKVPSTYKRGTKVFVKVYAYKPGYLKGTKNTAIIKIR